MWYLMQGENSEVSKSICVLVYRLDLWLLDPMGADVIVQDLRFLVVA